MISFCLWSRQIVPGEIAGKSGQHTKAGAKNLHTALVTLLVEHSRSHIVDLLHYRDQSHHQGQRWSRKIATDSLALSYNAASPSLSQHWGNHQVHQSLHHRSAGRSAQYHWKPELPLFRLSG